MSFKKTSRLKWINNYNYSSGVFWTICACFFSNLCDASIRLAGSTLPAMQIAFFRLFFGTLFILPILLWKGRASFVIKNRFGQLIRVIIGFGAIACWIYGASQASLPSITTISFSCPILVLPLAYLFLNEKSDWKRVLSIIIGFLGVIIVAYFEKRSIAQTSLFLFLHSGIVFLFFGAILFAMNDVLNKKLLVTENISSLLFYFYFGATLISFIPALLVWKQMEKIEIFYLLILGISGVFGLYCILRATKSTEISAVAPYKYIELVISIIVGYVLFNEVIKVSTIMGAVLIIPSAFLIAYHEVNKEKWKINF